MKSQLFRIAISLFAAFLVSAAMASEVSSNDVARAATAFVSEDSIGSLVLKGCSVANVSQRGHLWIVALSPSGHIVMSGSDFADPIVAFSKNDFSEPDPASPAFAVLEGVDSSMAALEAQGDGTRHERWTKLLGGGAPKKGLLRADNPSNDAVVVAPFMHEHFNQCQPYNDYAPVHEPDEDYFESGYERERGRCPCGCVATAAAQMFHYFRWPVRIDRIDSFNHSFTNANNVGTAFPLRLDGHVPIDWDTFYDDYIYYYWKGYTPCYDLRGKVAEMVRYPIARLILWCDVMANMCFNPNGSSANYDTITRNVSDWYTSGHWVKVGNNADYSQVVADLQSGIPLQVGLDGHQVVAHGWADDGISKYIYLNYGWSGDDDGYYNMNNSSIDDQMQEILVGHYPRAKPQIDPLPKVCETNVTLNWHFPDFYTNKLSGFTVSLRKTATETTTVSENFSVLNGVVSGDEGIFKVGAHSKGYDGNLLYCLSSYSDGEYATVNSAYYTFPAIYTLTSASVLTLKLRSCYAKSNDFEIQARFNGGEWTTIMSPSLSAVADSEWGTISLDLGDHGGEIIQLRLYKAYTGGQCYTDKDCIFVDDVVLTDVFAQGPVVARNALASARSYTFNGLDAGATYSFAVTPIMSGALVEAEASDPAVTTTAGEILVPVEGEVTESNINSVFPTNDDGVQWEYVGNASGNTVTRNGPGTCSVTAQLKGTLTENSQLTFSWQGEGVYSYNISSNPRRPQYVYVSDTLKVSYIDENNSTTVLTQQTNTDTMSAARPCFVSLSGYSGKKGTVKIELSCTTQKTTSTLTISQPQIENVLVQSVPEVTWVPQQVPALGMPEIRSVSSVSEGFYGECWTNTTTFSVVCSETIETLEARPSHLSLVRDEDVSVSKVSDGKFKVCVTPSGINETNFRSRMILTLVGTDSNGTKCYKDLSLRFSQVEPMPTEVHVTATTSSGCEFSVAIPYSWLEEKGLVASGGDAAAHESALAPDADADSDGLPNWAEYVCGTDPSDADDKLTVSITMVDGEPVVTYSPDDGRIASGFKAVIKGTSDLAAAFSTWEVVTETRTSTCRFFRVEIVPEN